MLPACISKDKLHHFKVNSIKESVRTHTGSWGGFLNGHNCCGQCSGIIDGRCHNGCGGICNKQDIQSKNIIICEYCGMQAPNYIKSDKPHPDNIF